jgi:hypothetical protein
MLKLAMANTKNKVSFFMNTILKVKNIAHRKHRKHRES